MDSFFGIGIPELFLIAIVALIVLGPERLPGAIREIAKVFRTIRQMSSELTSQFSDELQALDEVNPRKLMREITDEMNPAAKPEKKPPAAKPAVKPAANTAAKPTAKPAKPASAAPAKPAATPEPASTELQPEPKPDPEPSILPPDAAGGDGSQAADASASAPLAAPPARNGAGEQKDDAA